MKCVGSEDGQKQCQRCQRANVEYIPSALLFGPLFSVARPFFKKHRRGRKPGSSITAEHHSLIVVSRLSEASKMLRRLEKGLNTAKLKSQSNDSASGLAKPVPRAPRIVPHAIGRRLTPVDTANVISLSSRPVLSSSSLLVLSSSH